MPQYNEQPQNEGYNYPQIPYTPENTVDNIVSQIDPQNIIDNFNHALKGEFYNKEQGTWEMNSSKKPLVNDNCRGWIISYLTGIMNNASTMGTINEKQFSFLMEGVIRSVKREFVCNLGYFGFVKKGEPTIAWVLHNGKKYKVFDNEEFPNIGTPESSRMDSISEMIYHRTFLIYSRSIGGMESRKVFSSLTMTDNLGYQQPKQGGMIANMFR